MHAARRGTRLYPPLLLTGPPGIDKTTALRRACERLSIAPLRGFYTEEVRSGGVRRGFRLVTFAGERRLIADVRSGPPRVGKYGVDVERRSARSRIACLRPSRQCSSS